MILSPNSIEYFDKLKESKGEHSGKFSKDFHLGVDFVVPILILPFFQFTETDIWGLMGFRVAHQNALNEKRSRVIIITKGDIGCIERFQSEIKAYLTTNINLRWGEKQFFEKLRLAIAHPKYFKEKHHSEHTDIV